MVINDVKAYDATISIASIGFIANDKKVRSRVIWYKALSYAELLYGRSSNKYKTAAKTIVELNSYFMRNLELLKSINSNARKTLLDKIASKGDISTKEMYTGAMLLTEDVSKYNTDNRNLSFNKHVEYMLFRDSISQCDADVEKTKNKREKDSITSTKNAMLLFFPLLEKPYFNYEEDQVLGNGDPIVSLAAKFNLSYEQCADAVQRICLSRAKTSEEKLKNVYGNKITKAYLLMSTFKYLPEDKVEEIKKRVGRNIFIPRSIKRKIREFKPNNNGTK